MKIKVVGSSVDGANGRQFAASYIIDDCIAIDAGSLGLISSIAEQRAVQHVFLSHSHLDHIATLPIFLDNVYQVGPSCPTIYANEEVRDCLLRDVFNECVWPDLIRLSQEESPFLRFRMIEPESVTVIGRLRVTAVALNHVVPTLGFVIEDEHSAIALISDTAATDRIWEVARNNPKLRAVFLEAAFPNSMQWLADKAKHLTPAMWSSEARKLARPVPMIAVHIKAAFFDEVVRDLLALQMPQLSLSQPNMKYEF